jgi:hypothetical protein
MIEPFSPVELDRATRVAAALHGSWRAWMGSLPSESRSASAMSRDLGVDRTTCQRLVHAVRGEFAGVGVLSRVPGVPGLRRLLEASAGRVGEEVRLSAAGTVEAFADLINELAGSQSRLIRRIDASRAERDGSRAEAMEFSDEEGERRALFEAAARVTGRWSDLWTAVYLFQPDAARERMCVPRVYGLLGHRATPDAVPLVIQNFGAALVESAEVRPPTPGIGGKEGRGVVGGVVGSFSTDPDALVRDERGGGLLVQRVDARSDEPIDLMFASTGDNPHPRLSEPRISNLWAMVHFPAKAMLVDAYLPVEEARASLPSVGVHLWGPDMDLKARPSWNTRFPSGPRLQMLGRGLEGAPSPLHARHAGLTRFLFESVGADPEAFIGYRLVVPYPVWRSGYCLSFDFGDDGAA